MSKEQQETAIDPLEECGICECCFGDASKPHTCYTPQSRRDELAALRKDKARLDWLINQSNEGNGWLDDAVWDEVPVMAGDPLLAIRGVIDAAMSAEK